MKNNFQFVQKDDAFIFQSNTIRYILSNPKIQSFNEYEEIDSEKYIMYYYYDVAIYKKVMIDYNDEIDEKIYDWQLVCQRNVYDFPAILQFKAILKQLLNTHIDLEEAQKITYCDDNIKGYLFNYQTDGFICEDFYRVTKTIIKEDHKKDIKLYSLYLGCTFDNQGDMENTGIYTEYISEEDIKLLYKMIKLFIKYSIEQYNNWVQTNNKTTQENLEIKNNKIYQYLGTKDKIYSIMKIGDSIEVILKSHKNSSSNHTIEKNIIIKDIKNNIIIDNKDNSYNLEDLRDIFLKNTDNDYNATLDEIINDYISCMGQDELNDLFNLKDTEFITKYRETIINRKALYREEHKLPFDISNYDERESQMDKNIKLIINKIKEKVKEKN